MLCEDDRPAIFDGSKIVSDLRSTAGVLEALGAFNVLVALNLDNVALP